MTTIAEATSSRFEDIHRLLLGFDNPHITVDRWRRLLEHDWGAADEPHGYVLLDDDRVVGFIGFVFSRMVIRAEPRAFCNITTWIVEPQHRKDSLRLLAPLASLKGHTITNLSPTPAVRPLFLMSGFRLLDEKGAVVLPIPGGRRAIKADVITDVPRIRHLLAPEHRRILDDHLPYGCSHVLLTAGSRYCYVLSKSDPSWRVRVSRIHYASDRDMLFDHAAGLAWALWKHERSVATLVDSRFLRDRLPRGGLWYVLPRTKLYRSRELDRDDISSAYSEAVLLTP